ncbi:MAG: hypothetical protein JO157_11180 [Acetobacteraceae bacterium]|nr:hypothetical protein [Acetobacteraceae bacterium]
MSHGHERPHRLRDVQKEVMVQDAAALLDGKGWLPHVLRVPGVLAAAEGMAEPEPAAAEEDASALPQAAE